MNGTHGTDHGEGGAMFVVHGDPDKINGRTISGHEGWAWPTSNLDPEGKGEGVGGHEGWLNPAGRYYTPITIDFRSAYAEILKDHLGFSNDNSGPSENLNTIFDCNYDTTTNEWPFEKDKIKPNIFT
jgi:uncharacterized protein (DUF1501 family)